jgi:hypothetical protein
MAGGLIAHVALFDDKGNLAQFGPGDDIPEWARKKITNPNVWDGDVDTAETDGDAAASPPPKAGKGSGEDKWRAYAAAKGVDVTAIDDRNEIIAFLDSKGIPVE